MRLLNGTRNAEKRRLPSGTIVLQKLFTQERNKSKALRDQLLQAQQQIVDLEEESKHKQLDLKKNYRPYYSMGVEELNQKTASRG